MYPRTGGYGRLHRLNVWICDLTWNYWRSPIQRRGDSHDTLISWIYKTPQRANDVKRLGSIPSKRSQGCSSRDGTIWREKVQYLYSGYGDSVESMQTNELREQGSKGISIEKNNQGDTTGAKLLLVDAIVRRVSEWCIEWQDRSAEGSSSYYLISWIIILPKHVFEASSRRLLGTINPC